MKSGLIVPEAVKRPQLSFSACEDFGGLCAEQPTAERVPGGVPTLAAPSELRQRHEWPVPIAHAFCAFCGLLCFCVLLCRPVAFRDDRGYNAPLPSGVWRQRLRLGTSSLKRLPTLCCWFVPTNRQEIWS